MTTSNSKLAQAKLFASTVLAGAAALGAPAAIGFAASFIPASAVAQDYTSTTLTGVVRDDAGKGIVGATVAITSSQGVVRSARTGSDGGYAIPSLPFGSYKAKVAATGFSTNENTVELGQGEARYDFALASAGSVAEVVVTARRALKAQDFNRTDIGLAVDVAQIQNRIPIARDIASIVLLAPGVGLADPDIVTNGVRRAGQNLPVIGGTSAAEQVYYINGLNVTDQRTFLGFADLPFDAIESIDVKTGGYSAEFGRATGGVINVATKSGGNEFHGGFSAFYTPNGLRSTPKDYFEAAGPDGEAVHLGGNSYQESYDADVYLSGPIIKDRLFFFGIINPRETKVREDVVTDSEIAADGSYTGTQKLRKTTSPRWLAKFDLNITDKQRVEATLFSDSQKLYTTPYTVDSTLGGRTSPGLDTISKSGGLNQIYRYTGVWTDWLTLSALWGQVRSQYTDEGGALATPYVIDQRDSNNISYLTRNLDPGPYNLADQDIRESYRFDADLYFHLLGNHHIRVGYDVEQLRSTDSSQYSSGAYYNIRNTANNTVFPVDDPYQGDFVRVTSLQQGGSFKATQNAAYLQDSWRVFPRLTLEGGIRLDQYDYKTGGGESFIKLNDQYAPRVGATYDVFGNGADKIYASFGRYYLPIAENTAIREAAAAPFFRDYYAAVEDPAGNIVLNANGSPVLGAVIGAHQIYSSADAPDARTVAASNIQPMYSEEFIVGYDHVFHELPFFNGAFNGLRVGFRYVDRKLGSTIEDTNLQNTSNLDADGNVITGFEYGDGAIGRYCLRNGISAAACTGADAYTGIYTLINPGKQARVFVDVDGTGAKYITLTTADLGLPKATNHLRSAEFTFEKPWNGKWALQGSYVYSQDRGNYEGAVKSDVGQTDTSITQDFDTPFVELGATGFLPNDHRHTLKLFGSYAPIPSLVLGMNLQAQSGRHFGCIGYYPGDTNPAPSPSEWFCALGAASNPQTAPPSYQDVATPRGSQFTTPWIYQIDLSVHYTVPTPADFGTLLFEVNVFNLLDSQQYSRVVEQGDRSGEPGVRALAYGLPSSYQAPRTVRFGLRYAY